MTYASIDALQRALADTLFSYAKDRKKAAGRALGTLVEIVTFYALRTWGFTDNIVIERRVPEFANPDIRHNVEFSLHPVRARHKVDVSQLALPITGAKIRKELPFLSAERVAPGPVLGTDKIKRNAAVLVERGAGPVVANINTERGFAVVCELATQPFAIVECKRVGVEEGMKKGPQTIEKAKQGAYVARSVSPLQKVRLRSGQFQGFVESEDGSLRTGPYAEVLRELIEEERPGTVPDLILTVGIVSNHGNWFTSNNPNKELQVLSQSYDWLLFLTDVGLTEFIGGLLLDPPTELVPVGDAFRASYTGAKGKNRFTKVKIDAEADELLMRWFWDQRQEVERWFNVMSPRGSSLANLQADLMQLAGTGVRAQ